MASLGKLTTAFLQASQETTLTLANLNFNFALIKYDAPEEYRTLGESLSTRRKIAAEDGSIHIAARKLAALFQSIIPHVPNLIQAYGVRASEIAALSDLNPRGNARQGMFADHVGADGTSIWASATSGKDAVTMHLLACMLARIWQREQAVAIWTELVEQRKAFLHTTVAENGEPFQLSDLAASRIELSRSELDEWDSSARAWLETADAGQKLRQTQLRLIVDNISLPVSTSNSIYSAITEAWAGAMQALESLIQGAPQRINNGAVLLGLSAWHLYPNMLLAGTNQHITQSDPLVNPGGIITVGLQNTAENNKGVVWSLPLSQARYYGEPVMTTRHAGIRESQVSFAESTLVVVGSVLGSCQIKTPDIDHALELLKIIACATKSYFFLPETDNPFRNWNGQDLVACLSMLGTSAEYYSGATGVEKQNLSRLIRYGQRNCSKLLSMRTAYPAPAFDLTDFRVLLTSFQRNFEDRISFLRKWATRELDPSIVDNAIIRYKKGQHAKYHYANIVELREPPTKRRRVEFTSGSDSNVGFGLRWTTEDALSDADPDTLELGVGSEGVPLDMPPGPGCKPSPHIFVCGDPDSAAVYIRSSFVSQSPVKDNCMSTMQLYTCVKEGDITNRHIAYVLMTNRTSWSKSQAYYESLSAIEISSRIYRNLPGARVNLQAMSLTVSRAKWWQDMKKSGSDKLQAIMSCIAYFATGTLDINPDDLGKHTFAVCHGTSIFVASRLLGDPVDRTLGNSVERIIGNVGKPGLSFLVTPPDPKGQRLDPSSWHLIAHEKYDGKIQDSFQGTSFHLSFTGYSHPLGVSQRSMRDVPAHLLETAISVYDKDKWIADLDILVASLHWSIAPEASCSHHPGTMGDTADMPLISVDTWLEVLDPPRLGQYGVVRASGNPVARLATATLAVQMGRRVLILPERTCWQCQGKSFIYGPDTAGKRRTNS
ncbi:hypothetical protein GGR57DRAFT_493955 [Xylariaceae sp. FL1272]|nr:hypothetical protein GGR57DRAFT_493955 [Xylariaceae sp. FL1272]